MGYDFSLNRKKIILAFTSSVALVILIFMAGWMSGIIMSIPEGTDQAIKPADQERAAVETPASTLGTPEQKATPAKPKARADQTIQKPKTAISSLTQKKTARVEPITSIVRRPIIKGPQAQTGQLVVAKAPDTSVSTPTKKMAFSVQVEAFVEKKNAEDLIADLKGRGYEPYIFEAFDLKNQKVYTVRIGDYEEFETASQAAALFSKKENMPAVVKNIDSLSVVSPKDVQEGAQPKRDQAAEASKEGKPGQKPAAQKNIFTVQVESCIVEKNAIKTANDLTGRGYEVFILKKHDPRGKTWYAVQIGSCKDRKEASQVASEFTKKEKIVAVVVPIASYLLKERKDASSLGKPEDAQSGAAVEEAQSGSVPKDAQSEVKTK